MIIDGDWQLENELIEARRLAMSNEKTVSVPTTQETVEKMKEFQTSLADEIKHVDDFLLPLLREYLNNVRDVRMAFGREVKDILQSSRELTGITQKTDEIIRLASSLEILKKTLTPEMLDLLKKITQ